ncbi:MAG: hypothetical protein M3N82_00390 [Pseudomonadota bacterium]|nr:hypothetical protein [Pseudomonadota bacterium]
MEISTKHVLKAVVATGGLLVVYLYLQLTELKVQHVADQMAIRQIAAAKTPPQYATHQAPNVGPKTNAAMEVAMRMRENAWNRAYKRPAACDNPPDEKAFIACGNAYAIAHAKFLEAHPIQVFTDATTP